MVLSVFLVGLALLVFFALPFVAARSGTRKALVAILLLGLAAGSYVLFLASFRSAWDYAPKSEPAHTSFIEGVEQARSIAHPFAVTLLGPICGLAILALAPARAGLKRGNPPPS